MKKVSCRTANRTLYLARTFICGTTLECLERYSTGNTHDLAKISNMARLDSYCGNLAATLEKMAGAVVVSLRA